MIDKQTGGMTLRDYFAGQALAGALANRVALQADKGLVAKRAYEYADEMLKARTTLAERKGKA